MADLRTDQYTTIELEEVCNRLEIGKGFDADVGERWVVKHNGQILSFNGNKTQFHTQTTARSALINCYTLRYNIRKFMDDIRGVATLYGLNHFKARKAVVLKLMEMGKVVIERIR